MNSGTNNISILQAQLAEKTDLIAALTEQLEKTATQLDRLTRSGVDRTQPALQPTVTALPGELPGKLADALDAWQSAQPFERIERIESGIDQILDLLTSPQFATPATSAAAPPSKATEDFWSATKARLLGDAPLVDRADSLEMESSVVQDAVPSDLLEAIVSEIGTEPPAPAPVHEVSDFDELYAAVKTRDIYIQYLTSRLRLTESRRFLPADWEALAAAPDDFRHRLESLETLLKNQLRQAEVAHSLERALLGRERAKLAQIKHNLEAQIKRMAHPPTVLPPAASPPAETSAQENKGDSESRWKRIFSR